MAQNCQILIFHLFPMCFFGSKQPFEIFLNEIQVLNFIKLFSVKTQLNIIPLIIQKYLSKKMVKKKCDKENKFSHKKDGEQIEEMQLGTGRIKQKPKKQRKQGTTHEKSYFEKAKSYPPKKRKLVSKRTKKDSLNSKEKELNIQEREPDQKDITPDEKKIQKQDRGAPRKGCRWKTKIQILYQVQKKGKRTNDDNYNSKIISQTYKKLNQKQKQDYRSFKFQMKQISFYNFIRFLRKMSSEESGREKLIEIFSDIKKQMTKKENHQIDKAPKKIFEPQEGINSIINKFKQIVRNAYVSKYVDHYQNIINDKIHDNGIPYDQISSNSILISIQIDSDEKFKNLDNEYTNDQWNQIFSYQKQKKQKQIDQNINQVNYSLIESFCKESEIFQKKEKFVAGSDQKTNEKNLLKFINQLNSEQLKVIQKKYEHIKWKNLKKKYQIINKIQKQLIKLNKVEKKQQNNNDSSEKKSEKKSAPKDPQIQEQLNQTRRNYEAMQEQHPAQEDFSQNGPQQIYSRVSMAQLHKPLQMTLKNREGHKNQSRMDRERYFTANSSIIEEQDKKNNQYQQVQKTMQDSDQIFNVMTMT